MRPASTVAIGLRAELGLRIACSSDSLSLVLRGTARSGDVSIAYSMLGDAPETILLIMGLGGRAVDWGETFPRALAENYRVVLFDNRGTGASSAPDQVWTLEDMANDALAVLDALGISRAHIVGFSMGGMIGQLLALEHRERCDRLVLVSTHCGGQDVIMPGPEFEPVFQPARGTPPDVVTRQALGLMTAPGFASANPAAIDALVAYAVRQPTSRRAFGAQLQAILTNDRSARLRDIRVPTLIVHGDRDALIPVQNGRVLAERIPDARLSILEGTGHMPMWESAEALLATVTEFLKESKNTRFG